MDTFAFYLNLPLPLSKDSIEQLLNQKRLKKQRWYTLAVKDIEPYLTLESKEIFSSLKIRPISLVIFGHEHNSDFVRSAFVHTDLFHHENQWHTVPFAINWEITESSATINWWDTGSAEKHYPPEIPFASTEYYVANGIHYGERVSPGQATEKDSFNLIKSHVMTKQFPSMIRTDVPHSVEYSNLESRLSISLRFSVDDISNWEHARSCFNQFFINGGSYRT